MPVQELPNGAILLLDPTLDQIAAVMAVNSKSAGLIASNGNNYLVRREDWFNWETHLEEPTIFRSYDKCLRRCQKNRRLEADQPRWRPVVWAGAGATDLQQLLRQYVHQWGLLSSEESAELEATPV